MTQTTKTEGEFAQMIDGTDLSEMEIDILREDCGLARRTPPEESEVFRKRLRLAA